MEQMAALGQLDWISIGTCLAAAAVTHRVILVYQSIKSVGFHPGRTLLIDPNAIISALILPAIPFVSPGRGSVYEERWVEFEKAGCSIQRVTVTLPKAKTILYVADAEAIKEITQNRTRFVKPIELYGTLEFFGRNIVVSEGDEWKKYRKIAAPAFSESNNKLVWDETIKLCDELFTDVWEGKDEVTVDHCVEFTLPLALFLIGIAGFGMRMGWSDNGEKPNGHQLTVKEALHNVAQDTFYRLLLPDWTLGLTERTRAIKLCFEELERYMSEMIHERLTEGKGSRNDLFSNLLESNSLESGSNSLTERELVGNIFIFLLAGHETTAHTLCFVLGFLALYPNQQDNLYNHIKSVMPDGVIPSYEERTKLTHSLAAIYETMRLMPPVAYIPKYCAEDTTLPCTTAQGEKIRIPVPRGTYLGLVTSGLHNNPQYWDDADEFKYERFLGNYNKDAFIPFSAGHRSCIGKKFSETEAVAALTMIISQYEVKVKEEPEFANETLTERRARILSVRPGVTLTPIRVPLTFTRRKSA